MSSLPSHLADDLAAFDERDAAVLEAAAATLATRIGA